MSTIPRYRKKKLVIDSFMFIIVIISIFLSGCPGIRESGNHENGSQNHQPVQSPIQIDSAVLISHLAFISSAATEGRLVGSPGNILAQQYIIKQFDSLQLSKFGDSWLQPFPANTGNAAKTGNNVIGMIKGSKYPDSYIVITAHYDHLGANGGQVYYGADDNASGTAALLTMARYFKQHQPLHSLLFVAFDAEEQGLVGSRYFVAHSPVPLEKIMFNLNMDMISRNDNNEIYACGTSYNPFLKKYVDSVQPSTTVKVMFGHDDPGKGGSDNWTSQSDHYPFHRNNIPFLYFGVEDHADYHKPGDTFEKINKSFYYRVAAMITGVAVLVDKREKLQ